MTTATLKIAALLASALFAGFAAGSADAAGMDSFTDAAHDEHHLALDITRVSVTSDDNGKIVFDVVVPNYMHVPVAGTLFVFIDTDRSDATGSSFGDDVAIELSGADNTIGLSRWTGTSWASPVTPATLSSNFLHGARITINRSDLGNTESFEYWLATSYAEGAQKHYDFAPDDGVRSFDLNLPAASGHEGHTTPAPSPSPAPAATPSHTHPTASAPATPATATASKGGATSSPSGPPARPGAGAPVSAPKSALVVAKTQTTGRVARRGKLFGVGLQVRLPSGQPVTRGQITCVASVAGRSLKVAARFFDAGMAICGWKVPRLARGQLRATMRVSAGGGRVTKRFAVRIV
jgi:hypothetical protein